MTWENDKNETATQIYSFIADFDEKIYANEERREDSLIQQAAHMQTAFSFVSAALFMVAAIIIDNRGRISLEFLLVAFSSISAVLLSSLFCATQAQKRYKRTSFPNARQLQRLIENQHGNFCSDAQRHKYVVKTYSEIHESLCNVNESRVKWIKVSMISFYVALGLSSIFPSESFVLQSMGWLKTLFGKALAVRKLYKINAPLSLGFPNGRKIVRVKIL